MKTWSLFLLLFCILAPNAWGLTELSGQFGYQKQTFGAQRENKDTTRTYAAAVAFYLFKGTALEFNYSNSEQITTQETDITSGGLTFNRLQYRIVNDVYGVGLKQLLASRKSSVVPSLSLGYARQYVTNTQNFVIDDSGTEVLFVDRTRSRQDSVFATFGLQFKLTAFVGLNFSVQTVFPAFDFDLARDYIKYTAGFSWLF